MSDENKKYDVNGEVPLFEDEGEQAADEKTVVDTEILKKLSEKLKDEEEPSVGKELKLDGEAIDADEVLEADEVEAVPVEAEVEPPVSRKAPAAAAAQPRASEPETPPPVEETAPPEISDEKTVILSTDEMAEEAGMQPAKLLVLDGPAGEKGKEYEISFNEIYIGRGIENDFVIGDPTISRKHFRVRRRFDEYLLVDLGSGNGTMINGVRQAEYVLHTEDIITIGNTKIQFIDYEQRRRRVEEDDAAGAPTAVYASDPVEVMAANRAPHPAAVAAEPPAQAPKELLENMAPTMVPRTVAPEAVTPPKPAVSAAAAVPPVKPVAKPAAPPEKPAAPQPPKPAASAESPSLKPRRPTAQPMPVQEPQWTRLPQKKGDSSSVAVILGVLSAVIILVVAGYAILKSPSSEGPQAEVAPAETVSPQQMAVNKLIEEANELVAQKAFSRAKKKFEAVMQLDAKNLDASNGMLLAQSEMENEATITEARTLVDRNDLSLATIKLGNVDDKSVFFADAKTLLDTINVKRFGEAMDKAAKLVEAKNYDQALAELDRILQQAPEFASARELKAKIEGVVAGEKDLARQEELKAQEDRQRQEEEKARAQEDERLRKESEAAKAQEEKARRDEERRLAKEQEAQRKQDKLEQARLEKERKQEAQEQARQEKERKRQEEIQRKADAKRQAEERAQALAREKEEKKRQEAEARKKKQAQEEEDEEDEEEEEEDEEEPVAAAKNAPAKSAPEKEVSAKDVNDALTLFKNGDAPGAVAALKIVAGAKKGSSRVIANADQLLKSVQRFLEAYEAASGDYKRQNTDEAIKGFKKALAQETIVAKGESRYAKEINSKIADMYALKGRKELSAEQYSECFDSFQNALKYDSGNRLAQKGLEKLEEEAKKLYFRGVALSSSDPEEAKDKWKTIIKITPPSNKWHQKAKEKLQ